MYKVTLERGYQQFEFVFNDYYEASRFMEIVMNTSQQKLNLSIEKVEKETEGEKENEPISD